MFEFRVLFGVPVILLVLSFVACEQPIEYTHNGVTYTVPFFKDKPEIDFGKYELDVPQAIRDIKGLFDLMFRRQGILPATWLATPKATNKLWAFEEKLEIIKKKNKPKLNDFSNAVVSFLKNLLSVQLEEEEREKLKEDNGEKEIARLKPMMDDLLTAIEIIVEQNGAYLDWPNMKVGDESLEQFLTPAMKLFVFFKYHWSFGAYISHLDRHFPPPKEKAQDKREQSRLPTMSSETTL